MTTYQDEIDRAHEGEELSKANKKFRRMHERRVWAISLIPMLAFLSIWLFDVKPTRTETMILVLWITTFVMVGWLEIRMKVIQNKLAMMHDELNDLSGRDPLNGRHGYSISERSDW